LRVGGPDASPAVYAEQRVRMDGETLIAKVYDRAKLAAGNRLPGPAIVTEMDSTTVVLPGHVAEVDACGNLLLRPL
jgi:N-methylhydantoinase A